MHEPEMPDLNLVQARSIWLTGQTCSREQRRGRYTAESMAHPGKMIPAIARYLIHTFTDPGDLVLDPMAGIGTTVIEAMHANRYGVGVEYEHRWAELAAANLAHAVRHGATGLGEVYCGDSRRLPELLPERHAGRVKLVITSPPYGDSTHGHVRTPGTSTGKVRKVHHRYGDDGRNLAYRDHAAYVEEAVIRAEAGGVGVLRGVQPAQVDRQLVGESDDRRRLATAQFPLERCDPAVHGAAPKPVDQRPEA